MSIHRFKRKVLDVKTVVGSHWTWLDQFCIVDLSQESWKYEIYSLYVNQLSKQQVLLQKEEML